MILSIFVHQEHVSFLKKYYTDWSGSDLFWWFKDRPYYPEWMDDQLFGVWQDVPETFVGNYEFVEVNHR